MTVDEIIASQKDIIIREIPHFKGYYSMRSDGRIISHVKITERLLKESISLDVNGRKKDPTYSLAVDGVVFRVRRNSIYRLTFPDLFSPIENLEGEIWKDSISCPGFAVSNKGRIKRATYQPMIADLIPYTVMEILMTPYSIPAGTASIVMLPFKGKRYKARSVAKLVYETFNSIVDDNKHILYHDKDSSNLYLENLYVN